MTYRPPSVIVERLGREHATRLSRIVGGIRLHVPCDLSNGARLKRLLGEELAILVILHFGGSRLAVPLFADGPARPVDIRRVKALTARGWSAARIARKLGCTERAVFAKRAILRRQAAK